MIPPAYELTLSILLFAIGLFGIMTRRNAIIVLMSVEIILNAAILNLVAFASYANDPSGQVFALLAIAIAAAEAAIGLAIFLNVYAVHGTIDLDKIKLLRW